MHSQLRCKRHGGAEPEERVQQVQSKRDDAADSKRFHEGGGDEVEEREHGDDGAGHGEVDDRWVTVGRIMDHVTDYRHDEESPQELEQRSRSAGGLVLKSGVVAHV